MKDISFYTCMLALTLLWFFFITGCAPPDATFTHLRTPYEICMEDLILRGSPSDKADKFCSQ
jgi:hypothetical protein